MHQDIGPKVISLLPVREKKVVLWAIHANDPILANKFVNLLWTNSWGKRGPINPKTGLYQEVLKKIVWPGAATIQDIS